MATFTDLKLNNAYTTTFTASSSGAFSSVTSLAVTSVPSVGYPVKLAITSVASAVNINQGFQFVVAIQDSVGNIVI